MLGLNVTPDTSILHSGISWFLPNLSKKSQDTKQALNTKQKNTNFIHGKLLVKQFYVFTRIQYQQYPHATAVGNAVCTHSAYRPILCLRHDLYLAPGSYRVQLSLVLQV
jgi:hypothetical protein